MLIDERRKKIVEYVMTEETISARALAERLNVSEMTIWRDLQELEQKGLIRRIRGGVSKEQLSPTREPQFDTKQRLYTDQKRIIAKYAAEHMVNDGEIILLEGGTTVAGMVPYLTQKNLTVLTNGFKTMMQALPFLNRMNMMICGGILRDVSYTLVGPQAEAFFTDFRAQKFFVSATGLTMEDSLTDPNPLEIQIKRAMRNSASRVILLLDSSKFGKRSLASIFPLKEINTLITDSGAPQEILDQLAANGVEIHIAG